MKRLAVLGLALAAAAPVATAQSLPDGLGYFTVPPCRVVDTRLIGASPGSPMLVDETRTFRLRDASLSHQGGDADACGIPSEALAATLNIVAASPSGAGHLRVWAHPLPMPTASTLNYGAIAGLNAIANGIAVPICDTRTDPCLADFRGLQPQLGHPPRRRRGRLLRPRRDRHDGAGRAPGRRRAHWPARAYRAAGAPGPGGTRRAHGPTGSARTSGSHERRVRRRRVRRQPGLPQHVWRRLRPGRGRRDRQLRGDIRNRILLGGHDHRDGGHPGLCCVCRP